ncbi:receptor-like protein 9DC3 [Macadamia integrifolia]|uniref:receptor-like protein 9DC3 n=1 Tax=Macadamia integrifolia TaxID=60698 RepID=UPI001C5300F8|nr:receptor-like protein 9DC3 [Macadamia integrifolia]
MSSWWCFLIFLLLSLFQTCFLSSPSPSPSSPHLCFHDERQALLQLMQMHYHFHPKSKHYPFKSWNLPNTDCCFWEGITCDVTTGHVVGLDLPHSSLYGSIHSNSTLFHLHHLQMLNFSGNYFSGQIPSQISQFSDLVSLDLSFNRFVGQIPSEISWLTKLVFLDFSGYRLSKFDIYRRFFQLEIPNLRAFVQNLSRLRELRLDGVDLSAQKNRDWCRHLSSALPNLHVLSMRNCSLTGPLDASISNLRFLSELYLSENQDISSTVPSSLVNLTSLTVLSIWYCGFHGVFPSNVFLQPNLTLIHLSGNPLLSVQLPEFPEVNNSSLQYLIASATKFQGQFPSSVGNLKFLKILYLVNCNFSGALPPSLANLSHVTELDLSGNSFSGQIPSIFRGNFPNLEYLWLDNNLLQGPIHSYLFFLPSLRALSLSYNHFSGVINELNHNISAFSSPLVEVDFSVNDFGYMVEDTNHSYDGRDNFVNTTRILELQMRYCNISKFPKFLRTLKELTFLDLSYNKISKFPDFPGELRRLDLSFNRITKFPNFIRNFKALEDLDISSNRIDGAMPKWIWQLQNLSYLDLSNNSLTGVELPLPPTNQSFNIEYLYLYSNKIQDCLPTAPCSSQSFNQSNSDRFVSPILGNLTSLLSKASHFSISANKLTGKIPFSICSASNLDFLDLSNNQLSGTVPTCLDSSNLRVLKLESNKLIGNIPLSICNARYLNILDLSKNFLSGTIPTCLGNINLGVLNLESNKLHGPIPPAFKDGCTLHTLKLNNNTLQGKVPRSLSNCKDLEVLDIGYNQLNDIFPYWLENLSVLQVLVMRSNKFGGPIAQLPQIDSPFPSLHVIDLSFNAFIGNLPFQYILHWKAMMTVENDSDLNYISFSNSKGYYYQDTVVVMEKGLYLTMTGILTTFVTIDLSNNNFNGGIADALGNLKALKVLNLSGNSLRGKIPFSLGNLRELESLDLSRNKLSGEIPRQMTSLTFLSVLNVSYNNLIGSIPKGNQFDTFSNDSYEGNAGLCGLPLSKKCEIIDRESPPTSAFQKDNDSTSLLDWKFMVAGYCSGLIIGLVVGQQLFWSDNQYFGCWSRIGGSKQRKGSKRKRRSRGN